MNKIFKFLWIVTVLFSVQCRQAEVKEEFINGGTNDGRGVSITSYVKYYVDSKEGNDKNDGLSPDKPWKTLGKIWSVKDKLGPGSAILLKRGSEFRESIWGLPGSGSAEAPIIFSDYGDENLPKPKIMGDGSTLVLYLVNNSYWEISNLHITHNNFAGKQGYIQAIKIEAREGKKVKHIHISGCTISDVNGYPERRRGGIGLSFNNQESSGAYFEDILVENNKFYNIERDAIKNFSGVPSGQTSKKLNKGIIIRNNLIENVPGDGIVVDGADGALIEGNIIRYGYMLDGDDEGKDSNPAAGIWPIRSRNTVIRGNIVQDFDAIADGQAFDADEDLQNTLFEYNISYNNAGGFILLCPTKTTEHKNTIIRYNISINDGVREFRNKSIYEHKISPVFAMLCNGSVEEVHIYNNTIIKTKETDINEAFFFANNNKVESMYVTNNIFYNISKQNNDLWKTVKNTPDENIFYRNNYIQGYSNRPYGVEGSNYNRDNIYRTSIDPHPFDGAVVGFDKTIDRAKVTANLRPKEGSIVLNKGLAMWELAHMYPTLNLFPITTDFWGQYIGQTKHIGAYNH